MLLFLIVLASATLLLYIIVGVEVTLGGRTLAHLQHIQPIATHGAPRISIVVPACNEERNLEHGLLSLLAQDYPNFEIIAVNDRSTDSTGAILERIASANFRIRVMHIRELPPGWLGKNHALQFGARQATGEWLLFTDADVVMEHSVLSRAARYAVDHSIDHLAVPPKAIVPGFLPNAFLGTFALGFSLYTKPWKVSDPKSSKHIGIGAFNLVRASAYHAAGGHQPIAMRPDDDMQLGKLMKLRGYQQQMVFGTELISVEWYHSFAEMRNGLMKNLFAGCDYSVVKVLIACVMQVLLLIWPFVAVVCTTGAVRVLNGLVILALFALFWINAGLVGIRPPWCFAMPAAACVSIYLLLRSMILTLARGGIEWRGTRYPLSALRANKI